MLVGTNPGRGRDLLQYCPASALRGIDAARPRTTLYQDARCTMPSQGPSNVHHVTTTLRCWWGIVADLVYNTRLSTKLSPENAPEAIIPRTREPPEVRDADGLLTFGVHLRL